MIGIVICVLDQQVMNYCLGLSLRDLQESMVATLGEVLSVASCNRIIASVGQRAETFKTQPLESHPPILLVDGMWVKIAYPNGQMREDSRGRHRRVKRKYKRVILSALGVCPMVTGKSCTGRLLRAKMKRPGRPSLDSSTTKG